MKSIFDVSKQLQVSHIVCFESGHVDIVSEWRGYFGVL